MLGFQKSKAVRGRSQVVLVDPLYLQTLCRMNSDVISAAFWDERKSMKSEKELNLIVLCLCVCSFGRNR